VRRNRVLAENAFGAKPLVSNMIPFTLAHRLKQIACHATSDTVQCCMRMAEGKGNEGQKEREQLSQQRNHSLSANSTNVKATSRLICNII